MIRKIVAGVVLSTGALFALTGCGGTHSASTPIPVVVTVTESAPVEPTETAPSLTVGEAVALVRQKGSADIATWSDAALIRQFDETCGKFNTGSTFESIVYDLTGREIAPFSADDAGTVIAASIISTCPEYYSNISNF